MRGGVHLRTAANARAWLVADQPEDIRLAARDQANAIARPLTGQSLVLPAATRRQASTMDVATILALLRRGNIGKAAGELQKLIEADPLDPEPWCLRAMINLHEKDYEPALANAGRALELDPSDPRTAVLASVLRFHAHYLMGDANAALSDIEVAVRVMPDNTRAHLLKAEALGALERIPEARAAYRQALQLDPLSVPANVGLGLLEISQGWVVRGKKLVGKARSQMKAEADIPAIKAALALAELGIAVLGDAETHLAASRQYAAEVLANPGADPLSRIRALTVHAILALGADDLPAADEFVRQALNLAPSNPGLLLLLVDWAHNAKRDEAARHYLALAERISPDLPAVRRFRRSLGVTP
ncbi:MAG: tetratricopeptide repeat protein [Betaproteobacteria bacterium]|nr:tetratricopeptide repeat protein [Betaproteobacteria bacterium]